MLLLQTDQLPDAPETWEYEIKLDGCRAIAFRADGSAQLRSRNSSDFHPRYAAVATALDRLPSGTIIDGEVVAVDAEGRPSFQLLQNELEPARRSSSTSSTC